MRHVHWVEDALFDEFGIGNAREDRDDMRTEHIHLEVIGQRSQDNDHKEKEDYERSIPGYCNDTVVAAQKLVVTAAVDV